MGEKGGWGWGGKRSDNMWMGSTRECECECECMYLATDFSIYFNRILLDCGLDCMASSTTVLCTS